MEDPTLVNAIWQVRDVPVEMILKFRRTQMLKVLNMLWNYSDEAITECYHYHQAVQAVQEVIDAGSPSTLHTNSTLPQSQNSSRPSSMQSIFSCKSNPLRFSSDTSYSTNSSDRRSGGSQPHEYNHRVSLASITETTDELPPATDSQWTITNSPQPVTTLQQPVHPPLNAYQPDANQLVDMSWSTQHQHSHRTHLQGVPKFSNDPTSPVFSPVTQSGGVWSEQEAKSFQDTLDTPIQSTSLASPPPPTPYKPMPHPGQSFPPFQQESNISIGNRKKSTPNKNLPCPWCDVRYSRKSDLRKHVLADHEKAETVTCRHCTYYNSRESEVRSHHSKNHHEDCRVVDKAECLRKEQHERKKNWGCPVCVTVNYSFDAFMAHWEQHTTAEKNDKAYSTIIRSLIRQKPVDHIWKAYMKVKHNSENDVVYKWDRTTSEKLLRALEWGEFEGAALTEPGKVEELVEYAANIGTEVIDSTDGAEHAETIASTIEMTEDGKRRASKSPRTLALMMERRKPPPGPNMSMVPHYDNGLYVPQQQQSPHRSSSSLQPQLGSSASYFQA